MEVELETPSSPSRGRRVHAGVRVPAGTHVAELDLEQLARAADRLPLRDFLALAEAWRIARALGDHRGNRSAAARSLGIGRRTLYTKMEKLGLVPTWTLGDAGGNTGRCDG